MLRAAIVRGDYPPETTLPKQPELATRFGVSIGTVRRAVGLLEAEGLVTPVRRRGTVVRARPPMSRLGIDRYSKRKWKFGRDLVAFAADREASGRAWSRADQTQSVRRVPADPQVAEAFGIPPDQQVYERARLVKEDGVPTHTLTSYYLPEHVEGTPLADPSAGPAGRGGGFAVLTMQGLEPHHITEAFFARMPTAEEAAELRLPVGEPVMVLTRCTYTRDGRLVEFARGVHSASRFSWSYSFTIPD